MSEWISVEEMFQIIVFIIILLITSLVTYCRGYRSGWKDCDESLARH